MADWRKLYTEAVLETDPERHLAAITEAERAMEVRLKRLILPYGRNEQEEIENAAKALTVLRAEREGWSQIQRF